MEHFISLWSLQQAKEPQIVKKHQTTISDEIEEKILSMYGLGMSYVDISTHIEEIYQVSISTATISAITDLVLALSSRKLLIK